MNGRFDFTADELLPRDSHVIDPDEQHRLSGQTARIIARLEAGPACNVDLAKLSIKYSARISDARTYLKKSGRTIKVIERNVKTGYAKYAIVPSEAK